VIRVQPRPEPADFAAKVRVPGQALLRTKPRPSGDDYRKYPYWRECLQQLHSAYGEVCAYSAMWIPSGYTLDHFRPKQRYPNLAYEWSNYRLAMDLVNNSKGNSEIVLDPFLVTNGWFVLDKATLFVQPEPTLTDVVRTRVQSSINTLRLNHPRLVSQRFQILRNYIDGKHRLDSVQEKYPFIAAEIARQRIKTKAELRAEAAAQAAPAHGDNQP
jgi:hypothetical protein